jgi:hypothetical protein
VKENERRMSKVHVFRFFFDFPTPPFEERTDLGKSLTFLELFFLVNKMDNPTSNLT